MTTYKQRQELETDKQQTRLTPTGIKQNVQSYAITIQTLNPDKLLMCPFCLTPDKSKAFYIKTTKKQIDKRLGQCPQCKNKIMWKTLYAYPKWTTEQFADWVYAYRLSGFFRKINFQQWNQRLRQMDISYDFWKEYKRLKGENDDSLTEKEEEDYQAMIRSTTHD
jgi:hypothetical protein